jgi:hypothetical protein
MKPVVVEMRLFLGTSRVEISVGNMMDGCGSEEEA